MKVISMKIRLVILLSLLVITANAGTVNIDGLYYYLISSDKHAVLTHDDSYYYKTKFVIPETVTYNGVTYDVTVIDKKAFLGCATIKTLEIGKKITTIDDYAFSECSEIKSLYIPGNVKRIERGAFSTLSHVPTITIEYGLEYIGSGAFSFCSSIKELVIPNSVKEIDQDAFSSCHRLIKISLPENLTEIAFSLLNYCPKLETVVIGSKIKKINYWAFKNCGAIKDIFIYAEDVPDGGIDEPSYFFDDYTIYDVTLHVPAGSVEKYKKSTTWKNCKNIVPINDTDPKPTGISNININGDKSTYYDINGYKQSTPRKGLNIINGKKIIIK